MARPCCNRHHHLARASLRDGYPTGRYDGVHAGTAVRTRGATPPPACALGWQPLIATGILVLAVAAAFVTLFITRIAGFANQLGTALKPGGAFVVSLDAASQWLSRHG